MRSRSLMLVVALTAQLAWANPPSQRRGWLTGLGLGSIAVSLTSLALAIDATLTANSSSALLTSLAQPTAEEAPGARQLLDRRTGAQTRAVALFAASGALLAAGLVAILLDGRAPAAVAIVPLSGGAGVTAAFQLP